MSEDGLTWVNRRRPGVRQHAGSWKLWRSSLGDQMPWVVSKTSWLADQVVAGLLTLVVFELFGRDPYELDIDDFAFWTSRATAASSRRCEGARLRRNSALLWRPFGRQFLAQFGVPRSDAPHPRPLQCEGFDVVSELPTRSVPNWLALLTGASPAIHGIVGNVSRNAISITGGPVGHGSFIGTPGGVP